MTTKQMNNQAGRRLIYSFEGWRGRGWRRLAALVWVALCAPGAARAQNGPPPKLHVAGATQPGGAKDGEKTGEAMTWLTTHSEFTQTLNVEWQGPAPVTGLKIRCQPLMNGAGELAALTLRFAENEVPAPERPLAVQLTAELPKPDTYTTTLSFEHDGGRDDLALTITRVERKAPVDVLGVGVGRGTLWPWRPAQVSLRMSLHVKDNVPAKVRSIRLAGLTLKLKDVNLQARHGSATITVKDAPSGPPFDVRPEEPRRVKVQLPQIREAGEYAAKLRVALADAGPVDQEISFYVREAGWVAVGFITLGVLASTAVALYAKFIRRRIQQQSAVLLLFSEAAAQVEQLRLLPGSETAIFGHLEELLDELWKKTTRRAGIIGDAFVEDPAVPQPDLTPEITAVEQKLRLFATWVPVSREVAQLAEAARSKYQPTIDAAFDYLTDAADNDVTFESQKKALKGLLNRLRREQTTEMVAGGLEAVSDLRPNIENRVALQRLLRRLTVRRNSFDVLFVLCVLLMGILLGWKLFWVDSLTWGGWGDRLKCLLWGFGLHQITDATVVAGGLLGMREWFRSSNNGAS